MSLTRTIYTQGDVSIKPVFPGVAYTEMLGVGITGTNGILLSGVQSANFTANTPQQDVNSFGVFGTVDKIQVEPSTATMEISMVVLNAGISSGWLTCLVLDSQLGTPSGWIVGASGVGTVSGAVLTALRLEASVGALPTLNLTFDGVSGVYPTAQNQQVTYNAVTLGAVKPEDVDDIYWNGGSKVMTGCPQSIRVSWEMPVERLNCLGNPINQPTVFTRPPGTLSFVVEGIDSQLLGNFATGVTIGKYKIAQANVREVSRTVNMAVGEAAATFNTTSESVAMGTLVTCNV